MYDLLLQDVAGEKAFDWAQVRKPHLIEKEVDPELLIREPSQFSQQEHGLNPW